jgi:beta-lysine N6-acetyltransferase
MDSRGERDTVERFATARIQHGKGSDRVYIMEPGREAAERLLGRAEELGAEYGYGKLFAKLPAGRAARFLASGWHLEAFVPGLFGGEDGFFVVRYRDPKRAAAAEAPAHRRLMEDFAGLAVALVPQARRAEEELRDKEVREKTAPEGLSIRPCVPEDAEEMAVLYGEVFSGYPFPVDDPGFICETMGEGTDYFCVVEGGAAGAGRIIALASAERCDEQSYAEMTDFAVLPEFRGRGLSGALLRTVEGAAAEKGIRTVFTIARLVSKGMNAAFLKAGYRYGGTLYANTAMPEGLESMNVLYKIVYSAYS